MSPISPEINATRGQVADLAARRAYDQVWQQFAQHQSAEEFCSSWLLIQCNHIGGVSDGVVVLQKPGTSAFAPVAFYPENPTDRAHLAKVSERALTGRPRRRRAAEESSGTRRQGAPLSGRLPGAAGRAGPRRHRGRNRLAARGAAAVRDARPAMGLRLARGPAAATCGPDGGGKTALEACARSRVDAARAARA